MFWISSLVLEHIPNAIGRADKDQLGGPERLTKYWSQLLVAMINVFVESIIENQINMFVINSFSVKKVPPMIFFLSNFSNVRTIVCFLLFFYL